MEGIFAVIFLLLNNICMHVYFFKFVTFVQTVFIHLKYCPTSSAKASSVALFSPFTSSVANNLPLVLFDTECSKMDHGSLEIVFASHAWPAAPFPGFLEP